MQLKSGGPEMTVTEVGIADIDKKETVWCVWFDKTEQKAGSFPVVAVNKVR